MSTALFKNFAYSTLASAVSTTAQTTVAVQTGHGDRFPICNQGGTGTDHFVIAIKNTAGARELVTIVRRDTGSDVMTVGAAGAAAADAAGRGAESTTAATWIIGDVVQQIMTAAEIARYSTDVEQLTSVTGTDTVAGTARATITAYAINQVYGWIASGTNTGATTLNVSGLGAKNIYKAGSSALAAGDIVSGMSVVVIYDGTQFQLVGGGQSTLTVAAGGTGRTTGTTAYALVATGTTATGAQQTLASGATTEVLVGGGAAALPVWTTATGSGAPVRATSPTLASPTFTTPILGTPTSGTLTNCTGPAAMIPAASSGVAGHMTGAYATKLDGIAAGATAVSSGTVSGWGFVTSSGVTSVGATAPVASSGGATPTISMAAASSGVNGYMTGTYATKLDGIAASATNVTNNNQIANGAGYITSAGSCASATNITAYTINQSVGSGNSPSFVDVTITSDATLKTNWQGFDGGLLDRLAKVKRGIYDRKDVNVRQVGVSAQSLRKAVPEMVSKVNGKYQISQSGTLALVLELAEEVKRLRKLLEKKL